MQCFAIYQKSVAGVAIELSYVELTAAAAAVSRGRSERSPINAILWIRWRCFL